MQAVADNPPGAGAGRAMHLVALAGHRLVIDGAAAAARGHGASSGSRGTHGDVVALHG